MAKGSEYQKRQEGDATIFEVTPAPAPKSALILAFGIMCTGMWPRFTGPPRLWVFHDSDWRTTFKKNDIHRLILRNGVTDKDLPGMATYTTSESMAAGMALRARMSLVSNSLNVESGGKSTLLAGGMDETTAYGLLTDVRKILGFKEREYS